MSEELDEASMPDNLDAPSTDAASAALIPGHAARRCFFIEDGCIYLNHGAYGAIARPVAEAADAWRQRIEAQPTRFMNEELPALVRNSAVALGAYVGARGEDIVFLDNVTSAINSVLRSLVLLPGDEVVTTDHVYGAVERTLEFVCERAGARLGFARIPMPAASPADALNAVEAALTPRTRLLVIDHVTSPTALVLPLREIVELAEERGVPVLVDGAHGPGMLPLGITRLGAAWYAGNAHKWLGAPRGCGFLWTHPDRQSGVRPLAISHFVSDGYTAAFDWPGTRDFSSWLSVEAAIAFRAGIGEEAIRGHCRETVLHSTARLAEALGGQRGAPPSMTGSMAAVRLPLKQRPTPKLASRIRHEMRSQHAVEVDMNPFGGQMWVRLSSYLYNEPDDIEALIEAMPKVLAGL